MVDLTKSKKKDKFEKDLKIFFLKLKIVSNLFNLARDNNFKLWIVGGAIRDFYLGKKINDIDFVTDLNPQLLIKILIAKKIPFNDKYLNFGCVVLFLNNQKFTITSLREDYNQDGRYTKIRFTNSLKKDSFRRDFTFNALYLNSEGELIDFHSGFNDLIISRLVFIGDIEKKCLEDNLRIIRFIRFCSLFKRPKILLRYKSFLFENKSFLENISEKRFSYEINLMLNNKYLINSINLIKSMNMEEYFFNQIDFSKLRVKNNHNKLRSSNLIQILNDR